MRNYILSLALVLVSNMGFSQSSINPTGVQPTNAVEPPGIVLSKFSYENPNINPIWSKGDSLFSAQYREETSNLAKIIHYDNNGNVIARDSELENNTYPVAISKYYTKKYPSDKYSIWMHESGGNKSYFISRDEEVLWFNGAGKYNRTAKKDFGAKK